MSDDKIVDAEVIESSGAMMAYKAEQETQNSIARANPRRPKVALEQALAELEIVPEYACKAFYVIPFKDRSGGEEKIVNVEGPSIKAAVALAQKWGNNASGWRVKDQTTERVEVEGVYIDHETNTRTLRTKTVSRFYIDRRNKSKVPLREDKLQLAIAAGGSKAVRDAILAGMPVWIVDAYYKKARQIAAQTIGGKANSKKPLTYAEKLDWVVKQLAKKGVTGEQIVTYMKGLDADMTDDDRLSQLVGVYNSIQDEQIKADEVFGDPTTKKPADKGEVTMENVLGGAKKD